MQEQYTSRFYISATHKSSGKTIITLGLCAAAFETGLSVQPFKKGPDYIDPLWLSRAAQNECMNLDFNTQNQHQIISTFESESCEKALSIVEGNKGLYDGVAVDGSDSNAELAVLLSTPVVLVIDTQGTTRGVAPLLLGYQNFDLRVNIMGVILNKVAGPRHEQKLVANVEAHTDFLILGTIPRDDGLIIDERHLGLVPSSEFQSPEKQINYIKGIVATNLDLDLLLTTSRTERRSFAKIQKLKLTVAKSTERENTRNKTINANLRIGIPRDRAFGFYYLDDIRRLREAGCDLVFFNSLEDVCMPNVDGMFIGGGFPEMHMAELEANSSMRQSIRDFIAKGGPVYAECGGLMYLGESIRYGENRARMVGALAVTTRIMEKPVGRGYVRLKETGNSPWGRMVDESSEINAHEFHYSEVTVLDSKQTFAYEVTRGWGIDGKYDGLIDENVLASYSHLRSINPINWANHFVQFVRHTSNAFELGSLLA